VDPTSSDERKPQSFIISTGEDGSSTGSSPIHHDHSIAVSGNSEVDEPPSKKRKTAPCYLEMPPLDCWEAKMKGRNTFSSPIISVFSPNGIPKFALYEKSEPRQKIPFALDLAPQQMPSFLQGTPDPSKTTESLDLCINLTKAQEDYIESIEAWLRFEAQKNSKEWFGKQYNETDINAMFSSSLKRDLDNKYQTKLRAKFTLSGVDKYLTKVAFVKADGNCLFGSGWAFVKPLLKNNNWKNFEVRAHVMVGKAWIVGKKVGLRFSYTDLLIMEEDDMTVCASFPELD
jgi:hypothetical protein